jgi:hypothetical protein
MAKNDCSSEIMETINNRIYERNIPSHILQPYLSVRPALTKYSILPIVDPRAIINTPMEQLATYNVQQVFNPGNTTSPWSGFASSINVESELRNQIYALQSCSQSVYVPSSNSDLYNVSFNNTSNISQPFPELFNQEKFCSFDPNPEKVGQELFMNCTRNQTRNLTDVMKPLYSNMNPTEKTRIITSSESETNTIKNNGTRSTIQ